MKNDRYVKDLNNLGRDINTIIIIDDKEMNFSLQKQNGILIKPFFGNYFELKNDFILYDLFKILTKIILDKSKDARNAINKYKYEIKQKITKNDNNDKNNIQIVNNNDNHNLSNSFCNEEIKRNDFINENVLNNNINTNNFILKNNIINITQNYDNSKFNRCYSMSNSLGIKKYLRK